MFVERMENLSHLRLTLVMPSAKVLVIRCPPGLMGNHPVGYRVKPSSQHFRRAYEQTDIWFSWYSLCTAGSV